MSRDIRMQRTASAERLVQIPGYQVLRRLNQSQFTATYLAKHSEFSRKVVLKVFAAPPARQSDFTTRFLKKCQVLGQLRHPNIIQLFEGGIHRGACYLSLEYVSGATRIDELPLETPRHGLRQVADLARALQCAHSKGFIHGCIEAARVFVERERRVMLGGFEQQLLLSVPAPRVSRYLSPERKEGGAPDVASDIYSLGMLLYCLLVRRAPLDADFAVGEELKTVAAGVPALPGHLLVLQPLINRTLALEPEQRFSTAGMLADAIDAVSDEDIEAIEIATPHYLASTRGTVPQVEVSPPSDESTPAIEPLEPIEPRPTPRPPREQVEGGADEPRRTYLPAVALAVAGSLVISGVLFRDRLPPASELVALAQAEGATIKEWFHGAADDSVSAPSLPGVATGDALEVQDFEADLSSANLSAKEDEPLQTDAELILGTLSEAEQLSAMSEPQETNMARVEPAGEPLEAHQYVEEGDRLFAADALTVPRDANALSAYQQALALDPENAEAWAGLQKIVQRYVELAEGRIAAGDLSTAAEFVRRGLSVDSRSQELLAIQARLGGEGSGSVTAPEDLERLRAMARVQMVRENYVTPRGDSAYDHYSELLLVEPDNQEARSGLARIERELASAIEIQINRNRFDQAQASLVKAKDAFPTSQRFHNLTLALEAAIESEQGRRVSVQAQYD